MRTKEIKVRHLNINTITKLDELASQKGLSRNEYLKRHLESLAEHTSILEKEDKYIAIVEKILKVLKYNTLALNKFLEENLIDLEEAAKEEKNNEFKKI